MIRPINKAKPMISKIRLNAFVGLILLFAGGHAAQAQRISWPGAVVATGSGPLYAQPQLWLGPPVAAFTPGEQFCVIDADGAWLWMRRQDGTQLYAVNRPGEFLPDTTNPLCRAADRQGQLTLSVRIRNFIQPYQIYVVLLIAGLLALGITVLVAKGGIKAFKAGRTISGHLEKRRHEKNQRKYRPADLAAMQDIYSGFRVKAGYFVTDSKNMYRVNNNGYRYNLKKWSFDENTGEFRKILSREKHGEIVVSMKARNKRFGEWFSSRKSLRVGRIVCPILAVLAVPCWFLQDINGWFIFLFLFDLAALFVFALTTTISAFEFIAAKRNLGPEPLEKIIGGLGPTTAEAPASHPASGDLTY